VRCIQEESVTKLRFRRDDLVAEMFVRGEFSNEGVNGINVVGSGDAYSHVFDANAMALHNSAVASCVSASNCIARNRYSIASMTTKKSPPATTRDTGGGGGML